MPGTATLWSNSPIARAGRPSELITRIASLSVRAALRWTTTSALRPVLDAEMIVLKLRGTPKASVSQEVAEEAALAEDHVQHAGLGVDRDPARVSAGVQQAHVPSVRGGRVDDPPRRRVQPVGAHQQIAFGLGAVGEARDHTLRCGVGAHQPLAVLYTDAGPRRLVAQGAVQPGALHRTG